MSEIGKINLLAARALADELIRCGVEHVCLSPGSRSAPMAIAFAETGRRLWVHFDERSTAFFALGLAKHSRKPVVALCTSGTASSNFYPAVIEASYSATPLIVITCDRPPELVDFGSPQTIDQSKLYGIYPKWHINLPVPSDDFQVDRYLKAVARRAYQTALSFPAGVVHLNFPFREPLIPEEIENRKDDSCEDMHSILTPDLEGTSPLSKASASKISDLLQQSRRGWIVCGYSGGSDHLDSILELSARLGYLLVADRVSNLGIHNVDRSLLISSYDLLLGGDPRYLPEPPEVVLRIGASPTSKNLNRYLRQLDLKFSILLDNFGRWHDPDWAADIVIQSSAKEFVDSVLQFLPDRLNRDVGWLSKWAELDSLVSCKLAETVLGINNALFEGRIFFELSDALPAGSQIFVGNSMPVRDLETYFPFTDKAFHIFANRGANGIDGVLSTATGVAASSGKPVFLVIGDLSFAHDAIALSISVKHSIPIKVILVNNNGGGIFSLLPYRNHEEFFELLFGTPHNLELGRVAGALGVRYHPCSSWQEFRDAVLECQNLEGPDLIEIRTDRDINRKIRADIRQEIQKYIASMNPI
ncbi:2-succinyl-6-hydroxy-2,4-cyclohexadiene-1- carboxylic acid synthase/2-oxoglutarate decarboxylase [Thermobaculum terrenum ATCC BAA-798]|uniref:2-succinyl-5-enolpyruvyl-6-hydroxy-3-cyclohexene-1-carboxylate synthase n=1 Tax=Thermobaculum terrenum (strain ATCC BAA-798 / CCMEE 7001 / YNP1) TaxID=525904 RepID=D1CBH6_THET1|nr:2-succinyl-5-enolpyruvyl-6-hydroxy-3-cyclohexene-1-carboxylic-acid synthase [Thermobaculum terrenum]ACZ42141.1 2-succinyl-6-hydroxy-2,4-cyclohexadiene-1- carboxylic acid synthase/2-oxoglutarate decarboxylase [Thermobaculum terrenum ATCC BAA-798]